MLKKALIFLFFVFLALAIRVPIFHNAESTHVFHSDVIVHYLHMKHIHEGKHFNLYYYGNSYMGILEGLVNLAFESFAGFNALNNMFAPVLFFIIFLFSIAVLADIMFGPRVALFTLLFATLCSPVVTLISVWALGSHVMVLGMGTLGVLLYYLFLKGKLSFLEEKWFFLILGIYFGVLHFGYTFATIYFLAIMFHYVFKELGLRFEISSFKGFFSSFPIFLKRGFTHLPHWFVLVGFIIGIVPTFVASYMSKSEGVGLNVPSQVPFIGTIMFHIELLFTETLPIILGTNFFENRTVIKVLLEGRATVVKHFGKVIFLLYTAILWRPMFEKMGYFKEIKNSNLSILRFILLVFLGFYVFTSYAKDASSARYLFPTLTVFPIAAAFYLNEIFSKRKTWGVIIILLFLSYSGYEYFHYYKNRGFINKNLTLNKIPLDEKDIIKYMKEKGLEGGYADYWFSYRLNYFSNEEIIFSSYASIERVKEYGLRASNIKNPSFVCPKSEPHKCEVIEKNNSNLEKLDFNSLYLYVPKNL